MDGFELLLISYLCAGLLIKSLLLQKVNGHCCLGCILEHRCVVNSYRAICRCMKQQAHFSKALSSGQASCDKWTATLALQTWS